MSTPDYDRSAGVGGAPPPPPRGGMSTGAKVLIGCAIAAVSFVVLGVVMFGAGAWLLDRQLRLEDAGIGRQAEVTRSIESLESEANFRAPADGIVSEERASRFFAVTDAAWADLEGWATELEQRAGDAEVRGRGTLDDATFAVRGMGRARVVLGETLLEHRMPPSEYLWTGMALTHAYRNRGAADRAGIPAENLALVNRHEEQVNELAIGDERTRVGRGALIPLARSLVVSEPLQRRVSSWDTLQPPTP